MKKEEMFSLIQKELAENPSITSREIAKKNGIPYLLVKLFTKKAES